MAEERRTARRVRITGVRVTYESSSGDSLEADGLDLGVGGVFVRTATPLAVGKRVALEIHVVGEPEPWSALGRIVWARTNGEGDAAPPGMAVKFIDTDDSVVAAIERLADLRENTEPGVGAVSSPPPPMAPVAATAPERERTLAGLGAVPEEREPTPPPPAPREPSAVIDLATRKSSRPMSTRPPPPKEANAGRMVVVVLLLVVAAIAATVLLGGFLRPSGR